jgi:hypothetical protein
LNYLLNGSIDLSIILKSLILNYLYIEVAYTEQYITFEVSMIILNYPLYGNCLINYLLRNEEINIRYIELIWLKETIQGGHQNFNISGIDCHEQKFNSALDG